MRHPVSTSTPSTSRSSWPSPPTEERRAPVRRVELTFLYFCHTSHRSVTDSCPMRSRHHTRPALAAAAVLAVATTLLAPPPVASGEVTTLCTGYEGCQREGKGSAGYARANDRMYWQMYAGHNCTNYVAFR